MDSTSLFEIISRVRPHEVYNLAAQVGSASVVLLLVLRIRRARTALAPSEQRSASFLRYTVGG